MANILSLQCGITLALLLVGVEALPLCDPSLPKNNDYELCITCICRNGQGDCDGDNQCLPGSRCINDQGNKYGYSDNGIDVCDGDGVACEYYVLPEDCIASASEYCAWNTRNQNCVVRNNECTVTACGGGQTCFDPDHAVEKDFICSCAALPSIFAVGESAPCEYNECDDGPCNGQPCHDPNTGSNMLNDFVCTCPTGNVSRVGAPAKCCTPENAVDECNSNPCGVGQLCFDLDTAAESRQNFLCACDNRLQIAQLGAPVSLCPANECASGPCSAEQVCIDPLPGENDFMCTCKDRQGARNDTASGCVYDECSAAPCGRNETCHDFDTSPDSLGSYVCSCDVDRSITAVGNPVLFCPMDECSTSPCGAGQTCRDPMPYSAHLNDFVCSCSRGYGARKVGAPTVCRFDECQNRPCGPGQACIDVIPLVDSLGNFVCSCHGTAVVGAPVSGCPLDECTASPCGAEQHCIDPQNTETGNYICTCNNGVHAVGAEAVCELDECASSPCGDGQTCVDIHNATDSTLDFICFCDNTSTSLSAIGRPAACLVDECATAECPQATCRDPMWLVEGDFVCSCDVNCTVDECAKNPCPTDQDCFDFNTAPDSLGTFVCMCKDNSSFAAWGQPASECPVDECAKAPCGEGQACRDLSLLSPHNFVCGCDSTFEVVAFGQPAACSTPAPPTPAPGPVGPCSGAPCGVGQSCSVLGNNFACSCDGSDISSNNTVIGGPANCS